MSAANELDVVDSAHGFNKKCCDLFLRREKPLHDWRSYKTKLITCWSLLLRISAQLFPLEDGKQPDASHSLVFFLGWLIDYWLLPTVMYVLEMP